MEQIHRGLLWIDAEPARYWIIAWTLFAWTALAAIRAPERSPAGAPPSRRHWGDLAFAASLGMTLVAFRWPAWFVPTALNPDEAQLVAGAITLDRFPVYWKFVDGTTHGPVCEYLLLAASAFGAPLNYVTARVLATLLQAGSLLAVWATLRRLTGERTARLAALPGLAFWAFVSWDDFVHYSTELPGIFLLALAGWGIVRMLTASQTGRLNPLWPYFSGVVLALVPLAKLQSAPQALFLAATALVLLWVTLASVPVRRIRVAAWFLAGGLTVPAGLGIFLLIYRLGPEFWFSYVQSSLVYSDVGQHPFAEMPGWFFHFAATSSAFAWFCAGTLGYALAQAVAPVSKPPGIRAGLIVAWMLLGISYFCVLRPCREVAHYLHLLVIPLTTLAGLSLAAAEGAPGADPSGWATRWRPVLWFGLLTLLPQVYDRASTGQQFVGKLTEYERHTISLAAQYIHERTKPGDCLAIWGWQPGLYVETGLPQGTRDAHTTYQNNVWPLQSAYVSRYVYDLRRRQPAWFVDVVGPGAFIYESRAQFAHENTPALRELIDSNYEFLAEIGHTRIYHLKAPPQD